MQMNFWKRDAEKILMQEMELALKDTYSRVPNSSPPTINFWGKCHKDFPKYDPKKKFKEMYSCQTD